MNPRRVLVLLRKDFFQGARGFIFIYGVVAPVLISLVVTLLFGALFSETPRLGFADLGSSQVPETVRQLEAADVSIYADAVALRQAVAGGSLDMGIVLDAGFDEAVARGEDIEVTAYVWGQSLAKNRTIMQVAFADAVRSAAGQEAPVDVETVLLGEPGVPWEDRILPLVVLMAVTISGAILPATSLVTEKEKRTLTAVLVTPSSLSDVFVSKALMGTIMSLIMGMVILAINQAFGQSQLLLVMVLALGAVLAAQFGLVLGTLAKNLTTMFATVKFIGILLYAPALVYLVPQIPEWVGRMFPTYYIVEPLLAVSLRGGGWGEIAVDVFILIGLNVLMAGVLVAMLRRVREYAF